MGRFEEGSSKFDFKQFLFSDAAGPIPVFLNVQTLVVSVLFRMRREGLTVSYFLPKGGLPTERAKTVSKGPVYTSERRGAL